MEILYAPKASALHTRLRELREWIKSWSILELDGDYHECALLQGESEHKNILRRGGMKDQL